VKLITTALTLLLVACAKPYAAAKLGRAPRGVLAETRIEDCSPLGAGRVPCPVTTFSRVFTGHYTPGFESSEFIPCPTDSRLLPSDSLRGPDTWRAWVVWRHPSQWQVVAWPQVDRNLFGNPRYFVRWHGTVEGPGRYGHMGGAAFQLQVDTILEVREPRPGDC
jgi:hypothetical protein